MSKGRMLALVVLGGMGAAVWAQSPAAPAPALKDCAPGQDSTAAAPCKAVSSAQRFPFPGSSAAPAVNAPAPVDAPLPAGQDSSSSSSSSSSSNPASGALPASKRFPFPGDEDSSSSSSSSSNAGASDSSSSASDSGGGAAADDQPDTPKLNDKGSSGGRGKLAKPQTVDERVTEDIQVGDFYRNDENYAGAYLRAKDAFALMPDDAEVNLLYAEVAQKLGKNGEALKHYEAYLKLDPQGKKVEEAQRAVEKLSASKK